MPIENTDLYAIALRCAEQNTNARCSVNCVACQLNVFNYTKDTKDAALVKATAYSDYQLRNRVQMEKSTHDSYRRVALTVPALLVFIAGILVIQTCAPSSKPKQSVMAPATSAENVVQTSIIQMFIDTAELQRAQLSPRDEAAWLKAHQNDVVNVPRVLRFINRDAMWDYDGDAAIDCVDYSKLFTLVYGQQAVLVANKNPRNGMNHMFVRVFYDDGKFMDIEPQRTIDYSMSKAWGSAYDTKYNYYW